ncbi:MAG: sigma-70 family RNA polymerase sigma factor [Bryobacterales bacterium]|nr:sigma-70 family RNA polymerase sigma factor [Bryobacterales bacterium]
MTVHPEVRLAERLIHGDRTAFDEFVDVFRAKLFQYSYLNCGQREDAEEVAQETLMKAFQSFGQLQDPTHVKAWIFRIARNFCYMKRRKSVFAPAQEISLDELKPAMKADGETRRLDIADWRVLPDAAAQSSEMRALLHRAVAALPDLYRNVLLLRDIEELSVKETADVLDVSEDVVKTRLHRARLAVRKQIDDYLKDAAAAEVPAR